MVNQSEPFAPKEWGTKPHVMAECMDCEWRSGAKNAHAVGAVHARRHSHTVRVEVTHVYIYEHGSKYG